MGWPSSAPSNGDPPCVVFVLPSSCRSSPVTTAAFAPPNSAGWNSGEAHRVISTLT